jgi:hypothetical protein
MHANERYQAKWRLILSLPLSLAAIVALHAVAFAQTHVPAGLTAADVIAALQGAELPLDDLRQQPIDRVGPSGPPITEQEAWAFSVPSVAPSGGRILVFADEAALQEKAAWFTRVEVNIVVERNIILWLDPELPPAEALRYEEALRRLPS